MWGFILLPGGKELKSSIISAIKNLKRASDTAESRSAKREKRKKKRDIIQNLIIVMRLKQFLRIKNKWAK